MGTNYYAQVDFCDCCKRPAEELHIGKSSGGWAFLFMPHVERGLTTWAAWREYLATVPIKNEYGDEVTLEGLEDIVESKKGLWTHETCPDSAWGPYPRHSNAATPALALCIAILKATTANSVGTEDRNAGRSAPIPAQSTEEETHD